jgi:hypothetical protein
MSEKEELANLEKNWWYDKGECPDRTYKKVHVHTKCHLNDYEILLHFEV